MFDDVLADRRDVFGRWIMLALVVSLLLHGLGWNLSRSLPVESMSDSFYERIVPRSFQVERVDIDPRLLEPAPDEPTSPREPARIELPDEIISPMDVQKKSVSEIPLPALDESLLHEKPAIPESLPVDVPDSSSVLEESDAALRKELLQDLSDAFATTPVLPIDSSENTLESVAADDAQPGVPKFSNLDELLERTGPSTSELAPILLPGDVLFEYDAYELQPGAVASLEKLGRLLKRNPEARFVIEGHSDSFGPADYNMRLSQLRAESVKAWLIERMGIDGMRIQTRGLGQSRLLIPPTESVESQLINRRVEIVIQNSMQ
jgi:outer membrane protein OmpA-like peptidoglycan-associated protein